MDYGDAVAEAHRRIAAGETMVVYTAGVWDMLHGGHIRAIRDASRCGNVTVVGVVTDGGCAAYKGFRPHEPLARRMAAVRALPFVDFVVAQNGTDPTANLVRFRPWCMTHGAEWERLREGADALDDMGIAWVRTPMLDGMSSTFLRAAGYAPPEIDGYPTG